MRLKFSQLRRFLYSNNSDRPAAGVAMTDDHRIPFSATQALIAGVLLRMSCQPVRDHRSSLRSSSRRRPPLMTTAPWIFLLYFISTGPILLVHGDLACTTTNGALYSASTKPPLWSLW